MSTTSITQKAQPDQKDTRILSVSRPTDKYRPPRPRQLLKCWPSQLVKPPKHYAGMGRW